MSDYVITDGGELYHYGVLGMKWGKRKAQKNAEKAAMYRRYAKDYDPNDYIGSKPLSNRQRSKMQSNMDKNNALADKYQKKSTYTYKSHSTKKYDRKAATANESAKEWEDMAKRAREKGKGNKAVEYERNAKADRADAAKYANRAKRSKELDRNEQRIAEQTSTGKVLATRLLLTGGVGAKNYQQFRAMGNNKVSAAGKAAIDVMFLGGIGSRVMKAKYLRQDEK